MLTLQNARDFYTAEALVVLDYPKNTTGLRTLERAREIRKFIIAGIAADLNLEGELRDFVLAIDHEFDLIHHAKKSKGELDDFYQYLTLKMECTNMLELLADYIKEGSNDDLYSLCRTALTVAGT